MKTLYFLLFMVVLSSCKPTESEPIKLNIDQCHQCKMNIANGKFGAEIITEKGRIYKFDDVFCLVNFKEQNPDTKIAKHYIHEYAEDNVLIPAENAFYCKGGNINSPMHGNIIATKTQENVTKFAAEFGAKTITWSEIINSN